MTQVLVARGEGSEGMLPALFAPDAKTAERVIEFFTAHIRNPNTRKAYARATATFAAWCGEQGITELNQVRPVHVISRNARLLIPFRERGYTAGEFPDQPLPHAGMESFLPGFLQDFK